MRDTARTLAAAIYERSGVQLFIADAEAADWSVLETSDAIAERVMVYRKWKPHRRDLDMAEIRRHSRLQSWALKPAWPDASPAFA